MFIQDISGPKSRVNMPALNMEVFSLWESDENDIHNLPAEASDDDFCGRMKKRTFREKTTRRQSSILQDLGATRLWRSLNRPSRKGKQHYLKKRIW